MQGSFRGSENAMENKASNPHFLTAQPDSLAVSPRTATVNVTSSGNGIAIGAVNGNVNLSVASEALEMLLRKVGAQQAQPSHSVEWASLDTSRYNVFVVENEKYNSGTFCIGRSVALKNTPAEYREYFSPLSVALVGELLNMPCLFAVRNLAYKNIPDNYLALLGRLVSIERQGENIRFSFSSFAHFPQQLINENIRAFGLLSRTVRNQLDEEHWSIRPGNLPRIVAEMGIEVR